MKVPLLMKELVLVASPDCPPRKRKKHLTSPLLANVEGVINPVIAFLIITVLGMPVYMWGDSNI